MPPVATRGRSGRRSRSTSRSVAAPVPRAATRAPHDGASEIDGRHRERAPLDRRVEGPGCRGYARRRNVGSRLGRSAAKRGRVDLAPAAITAVTTPTMEDVMATIISSPDGGSRQDAHLRSRPRRRRLVLREHRSRSSGGGARRALRPADASRRLPPATPMGVDFLGYDEELRTGAENAVTKARAAITASATTPDKVALGFTWSTLDRGGRRGHTRH